MYGYIYITTNLKNNQKYVGQKKGIFKSDYFGSGVFVKRAVNKYEEFNFNVQLINYAYDKVQLDELEKNYFPEGATNKHMTNEEYINNWIENVRKK